MNKKIKRSVLSLGLCCAMSVVGALGAYAYNEAGFYGTYDNGNPYTSAPWGRAKTSASYDTDSISAKITVWNNGKYTKHDLKSAKWSHYVATKKVYGANYKAAGTKFEAYYTGTDFDSSPTFWEDCDDWAY